MSRPLILVAGHGEMGGGEVMLAAFADAAAELGWTPAVVAPSYPGDTAAAALRSGHEVVTVDSGPGESWVRGAQKTRKAVRALRRANPNSLIWCHGLRPALATVGLRHRMVHAHRAPSCLQSVALLMASAGSRVILVPSDSTRAMLPRSLMRRTRVLQNWTRGSVTKPSPRSRHSAVSDAPVVGFLGRLAPEKGITDLVMAFETLTDQLAPSRPLLRVGGAPRFVSPSDAAELNCALNRLEDQVDVKGWVDSEEFLADIDVLVCPSRVAEAFGLVVAEAMAAGVPVVVTDAGALTEVVGPYHPYIARAGDPDSLAHALRHAVDDLGTEEGYRVVAAARRRWEEKWSPAAGIARVRNLLADLEEIL